MVHAREKKEEGLAGPGWDSARVGFSSSIPILISILFYFLNYKPNRFLIEILNKFSHTNKS